MTTMLIQRVILKGPILSNLVLLFTTSIKSQWPLELISIMREEDLRIILGVIILANINEL